jgi:hypothetical protein
VASNPPARVEGVCADPGVSTRRSLDRIMPSVADREQRRSDEEEREDAAPREQEAAATDDDAPASLVDVLDQIERRTQGRSLVRVEDILDAFAGRLFGPLIVAPSVMVLSPLGAIPLAPSLLGLLLALIAGQRLFGRRQPWTPRRLRARGVERPRMVRAFERVRPWAARIDRLLRPRLVRLVGGEGEVAAAAVVVVMGLSMPVIGLAPLAVWIPGLACLLFGLALTARDGLLALLGFVASIGGVAMAAWILVELM